MSLNGTSFAQRERGECELARWSSEKKQRDRARMDMASAERWQGEVREMMDGEIFYTCGGKFFGNKSGNVAY